MAWLLKVARVISTEANMPVEWVTPLGWPVVQPYFKIPMRKVKTVLQEMGVRRTHRTVSVGAECGVCARRRCARCCARSEWARRASPVCCCTAVGARFGDWLRAGGDGRLRAREGE